MEPNPFCSDTVKGLKKYLPEVPAWILGVTEEGNALPGSFAFPLL